MSKSSKSSLSKILKSSLIISLLSLSSITYSFAFEPIGRKNGECDGSGFTGEFSGKSSDGTQYKITGLNVQDGNFAGLFGCVSNGANIHDVVVEGAGVNGNVSVGGLIGYVGAGNTTTVKNIGIKVPVSGQNAVGGVIGKIEGKVNISNSYMSKNVSGTGVDGQVGGIVGVVVGGQNVVIQNSYMSGDLNTPHSISRSLGGIVGANLNWYGNTYLVNNVLLGRVNPSVSGSNNPLNNNSTGVNVGLLVGLDQYYTINRPYLGSNTVNHSQYCDDRFGGVGGNDNNTANFASGTLKLIGNNDNTIVNVYNNKASTTRYITNYSNDRYPGLTGFSFPNLYNGSNVNIGFIQNAPLGIYAKGNNNDPRKISDYVYGIPSFGGFKLLRYKTTDLTDFVGGQDTAYSMSSKPQCPFIFTIKPVI